MANLFNISIVTPEKIIYHGEIRSVIVPAKFGYLEVLAHHAALIAQLAPGKITVQDGNGENKLFSLKGSGFLQVAHNSAKLLLDAVA